jgi:hypothetical protein
MKTLNRPMFRYGGPIKEGVMNGIREPKRNGGSMGEPQAINTVGSPLAPQGSDGRQQYAAPILYGLGAGAMAAGRAAMRFAPQIARGAKRIFGKTTTKPAPYTPVRTQTTGGYSEYGPASYTTKFIKDTAAKGTPKGLGGTEVFTPNFIGRDPLIGGAGKLINALTNPTATGMFTKGARLVFSPSGAVLGGLYYANGKYFNKKNEEVEPPPGAVVGGEIGEGLAEQAKELSPAEIKAAENKARMEKMDSYREIMDIKGMNKDAAYKSLIDASKIIQEGGNLKKQLKDGSLISKVTEAASKNFDKVRGTENALSSLLVKSKIESDLRAEQGGPLMQQAKDLVNAGGAANIQEAMEYLSKKPSIVATATDYAKKFGKGFVDQDTAILAIQETFKERATPVITEKEFETFQKADGYTTAIDLFEKLKGQKKLGEGYYVIGGNGFVVDERGNTKQVL